MVAGTEPEPLDHAPRVRVRTSLPDPCARRDLASISGGLHRVVEPGLVLCPAVDTLGFLPAVPTPPARAGTRPAALPETDNSVHAIERTGDECRGLVPLVPGEPAGLDRLSPVPRSSTCMFQFAERPAVSDGPEPAEAGAPRRNAGQVTRKDRRPEGETRLRRHLLVRPVFEYESPGEHGPLVRRA